MYFPNPKTCLDAWTRAHFDVHILPFGNYRSGISKAMTESLNGAIVW